ncbi:FAD-dependent oxidoreductase, partial [Nonlabens mediterrranea]|nr:FAD-dependent oxidoreductase [Nonlabens mediterrranea]
SRHVKSHHIDLKEEEEMAEIIADDFGKVKAIITKKGQTIPCDFVGLCAGVRPRISFLENSGIELQRGIMVNRYLETSVKNVYAIGDCAQQREPVGERKSIEAVWYTGRMMGEALAQTICGNPTKWNPGHWFNSAKFFDIEYQTYGWVWSKPKQGHDHFHWLHEDDKRAVTIEYDISTRKFIGINTFGIRMKHEVFDLWLSQSKSIDEVIENLDKACFNPEFFNKPFEQIKRAFSSNQQIKS